MSFVKSFFIKKSVMLLTFVLVGTGSSFASQYPDDYSFNSSCITNGPLQVCRAYQPRFGAAVLNIYYQGSLMTSPGLNFLIRVNYKEGSRQALLPMSLINGGTLGFLRVTGGCVVADQSGCVQKGTAEMAHLLFWAQRMSGTLNALNLDVALVDGNGNWDNNGQPMGTYHFDFTQD